MCTANIFIFLLLARLFILQYMTSLFDKKGYKKSFKILSFIIFIRDLQTPNNSSLQIHSYLRTSHHQLLINLFDKIIHHCFLLNTSLLKSFNVHLLQLFKLVC